MQRDRGEHRFKMTSFLAHLLFGKLLVLLIAEIPVITADTCSFENGMCSQWVSSDCGKQACFKVHKVADMIHGPAADHTRGTDQGRSAYATWNSTGGRIAVLTLKASGPLCFTAWYHQSGTEGSPAEFRVDYRSNPGRNFYVTRRRMAGRWQRVRYYESRMGPVELSIRYFMGDSPQKSTFAVDDLTTDNGRCPEEPQSGSCDFDWGTACGYDLGRGAQKWLLEDRIRKNFTQQDYSTNTVDGGLLYWALPQNRFMNATITSPVLKGQTGIQCLQFYYYVPSSIRGAEDVPVMSVEVKGSQDFTPWVRKARELLVDEWIPVDLAFKMETNFKIEFQCSLNPQKYTKPYCAIDAIRLNGCKGNRGGGLCNFEDGWCSWRDKDEWGRRPMWELSGAATKTTLLRPLNDHTFGTDTTEGSYLYFSNYQRRTGDQAEVVGELLPLATSRTQCAEFWYIISGDNATKLQVLARDPHVKSSHNTPLWGEKGTGSTTWQMGRVAVPDNKRVIFRGTAGPASTPAYVALDDIAIGHQDKCETLPQAANVLSAADLLSCSFSRSDLCHWISSGLPSSAWGFLWYYSALLGPPSAPEHSKGGVYMLGDTLAKGDGTVLLQSPLFGPQSEPSCFSVWYHMFGGRGVSLSLSVEKPDPKDETQWISSLLLVQTGRTTADRWYNVRRTLMPDGVHNKVTFTLKNAPSLRKHAIVSLSTLKLTPGVCDVLTDGEGYCDFEFDTCTWSANNGWRRAQREDISTLAERRSGPVNSVYVMTATQSTLSSGGAELTSPEWQGQTEPMCLEFWYRSGGKTGSQLQVDVVANGKSQVVWTKPSYKDSEWMLVRTQIVQEKDFKVVFRAKSLNDPSQSVSLDDVVLRPDPCVHPAECDFSDGLCGYVNEFQGDFRWLVGTGRLESNWMQPDWPTSQDRPLSFAYLDFTTGKAEKDVSAASARVKTVRLLSPLFDATGDTSVTLSYFRNGKDIKSARLSMSCFGNNDKSTVKLDREIEEFTTWNTMTAVLDRGTNCQLAVSVKRGDGAKGAMAVGAIEVKTKQDPEPTPSSDSPTRCTFEGGTMCGWRSRSTSARWVLNDPSKKLPDYPRFDHTVKAYTGRFVFASNNGQHSVPAFLESPDLEVNATNGACLSFWLFTDRSRNNYFTVLVGDEQVYETDARASHRWEHMLVYFKKSATKLRIKMKAFFAPGLVALDDIQVNSGSCPITDFCSWEEGSPCVPIPAPGGFATWEYRRGADLGIADHTLKSLEGRFLYLNTTGVDAHHPISRVFMPTRPRTGATCVTFWWSARGDTSKLNIYRFTKESVLRDPIINVTATHGPGNWTARTVTVSSISNWTLVFEGVAPAGAVRDSGIMLDDVEFADGACPPYDFCAFENECLPWNIPTTGDEAAFEVERAGSFRKLPEDHTTQTPDGYYLLFKSPGTQGNRTSMELREPIRYNCLSFWYYMPTLAGGVSLYVQRESITAGKGVWKHYEMPQPSLWAEPIVATSGNNPDGFVAIDDVLLNEWRCSQLKRTTETIQCDNKTLTLDRVCDFVPDCKDGTDERDCGDCDFSDGLCGWDLSDRLYSYVTSWQLKPIGDVSASPLAGADGRENGNYLLLYAHTKGPAIMGTPMIYSPIIRNTNKLCTLHFWYNIIRNGSFLDVSMYMNTDAFKFPIWTLSALSMTPVERVWNEAVIEVGRNPRTVNFALIGNRLNQGPAMFVVDLVQYKDCALPAKEAVCPDYKFHCTNGACVDLDSRCNYLDDCGDNSDEHDCGDFRLGCNFDASFCDWAPQAPSVGTTTWTLNRPALNLKDGPTRDHTNGEPVGGFLMLRADSRRSKKMAAAIIGHTLENKPTCGITFFYTIQGNADSELKLAVRTTKDGPWKILWKESKPTQFFYFTENIIAFSEDSPYQVAFIGEHKNLESKRGYIAIDDVTFTQDCAPYHEELPPVPPGPTGPPVIPLTPRVPGPPVMPLTPREAQKEPTTTPEPEDTWPTAEIATEAINPAILPPKPSVECPRGTFNCRDGSTCIPAVLLCDGVSDCPNGLDEKCGSTPGCKDDEFYCPSRSPSSCLPRSKLCNGHEDCEGGSDESLCRRCPENFCQNDAVCGWTSQVPFPNCRCTSGYQGRRCELSTQFLHDKQAVTETSSTGSVVAGVMVVLIVVVIAVALTVYFIRRRNAARDTPLFVHNATYDASTGNTTLFN